jgi:murein L,D-transpeptidase YafK
MIRKTFYVLLAVAFALLSVQVWHRLTLDGSRGRRDIRGRGTVQQRLRQYAPAVQQRLNASFKTANVPYPPRRLIFVGLKGEKVLQLWAAGPKPPFKLICTYPILAASGRLGPKLQEGDLQVPEGLYRIESLNPNSRFHLSLRLNYPNEFDRARAKRDGRTNLGGDIMIHGSNVSIGCLAMGDEAAEDLFVLTALVGRENVSVILSPVDLGTTMLPELPYPLPPWTDILYDQIRRELSKLSAL